MLKIASDQVARRPDAKQTSGVGLQHARSCSGQETAETTMKSIGWDSWTLLELAALIRKEKFGRCSRNWRPPPFHSFTSKREIGVRSGGYRRADGKLHAH